MGEEKNSLRHISSERIKVVLISGRVSLNSTEMALEIEGVTVPDFAVEIHAREEDGAKRFVGYLEFKLCSEEYGRGKYLLNDVLPVIRAGTEKTGVPIYNLGADLSVLR